MRFNIADVLTVAADISNMSNMSIMSFMSIMSIMSCPYGCRTDNFPTIISSGEVKDLNHQIHYVLKSTAP